MKLFLAKKKPQRKKKQIRASHKYYGNLGGPIFELISLFMEKCLYYLKTHFLKKPNP